MDRLRIVLEFNKANENDMKIYKRLIQLSNPGALVKDVLKGILPLDTIDTIEEGNYTAKRLRIVLEFSKSKKSELELYSKLIRLTNPGSTVKDVLKGVLPLNTIDTI